MTHMATWEGVKIFVVRPKGKKLVTEPATVGRAALMKESYKYPIGIILQHQYDTYGKGGGRIEHSHVFYKGKDAEVLSATDLEHPDINRIENYLAFRDEDESENDDYIPGVTYEKPDVNAYTFRKKKSTKAKPKPKRKVVKKCKCK